MSTRLADSDEGMQVAAVDALGRIAKKGDVLLYDSFFLYRGDAGQPGLTWVARWVLE